MPMRSNPAPFADTNRWLAEMGYATWRMVVIRTIEPWVVPTIPATLEDCQPQLQEAWEAAAAAIRRRVVNWHLPAEDTAGLGGQDDADV